MRERNKDCNQSENDGENLRLRRGSELPVGKERDDAMMIRRIGVRVDKLMQRRIDGQERNEEHHAAQQHGGG